MSVNPARALTAKQEAFSVAVAKGRTASDAYRASYGAKDMSAKTITEAASRLVKNSKVAARVAELRAPALEASQVDVDRWVRETSKYAFAEPSDDLKHADKRGYLEMMGRSLGAYEKDNKQKAPNVNINVVLE